jgi:hypothetical protein
VLVPPDDPRAVAAALRDLDDRDRLVEMGVAARRDYETRPGWPETLDRVAEFLEAEAARGADDRAARRRRERGERA